MLEVRPINQLDAIIQTALESAKSVHTSLDSAFRQVLQNISLTVDYRNIRFTTSNDSKGWFVYERQEEKRTKIIRTYQ